MLPYITANATILIVGGGTGWVLDEITRFHPAGLKITYVEVSEKMMAKSRKRHIGQNEINYINEPIQDTRLTDNYDIVITAFLFDNFKVDILQKVFAVLHRRLKQNGLWLNTDFQLTGKWWQSVMLKSMLQFFRTLCDVEASALPDIDGLFKDYQTIESKTFFGDFISSKVFKK
ncbi:class I SAM-dependent methyltransferase [Mucilaginibacter antarcticus]|uniref:class I SAM-dependent methyltransferase n=1 Tax=Mucilaginibacter antarcticus TaxID=1855725 RepID=UPI00362B9909